MIEQLLGAPWWVEDRRPNGLLQVMAQHRGPGSVYCVASVNFWEEPLNLARALAAVPELLSAAHAAIAYDAAIRRCGNDPALMSSFCSAEGEDLDALYARWIDSTRAAIAKITGAAS